MSTLLEAKPKPLAQKWGLGRARPRLRPVLEARGLPWAEVLPILRALHPAELQQALEEPEQLVDGLGGRPEPLCSQWGILLARAGLEPLLQGAQVDWQDVVRVLGACSPDDLASAAREPREFLDRLDAKTGGEVARLWAVAKLRRCVEPLLPEGNSWEDIVPAVLAIDTLKQLRSFMETGAELLLWRLQHESTWPPSRLFALPRLRPTLEPHLPQGVRWADFLRVLEELPADDEWDGLPALLRDPGKFLLNLIEDGVRPGALPWAAVRLRPRLDRELHRRGVLWEEALPALLALSIAELREAWGSPAPLLLRLQDGPEGILPPGAL
ncbi:unnamed protein product [Prorocentrum cordatum]|uniref:Uncharacterized protein n=1 Tax=Prorocentrum cordatum TaxID=2364126 RepID=A0ABN9S7W8_9DINO|nr:unnamed protein product [Polarella glacialis]